MGKSPARWIKTVLFGKKSSRSNSTKKGAIEKVNTAAKGPACTETSPVISDPVLVTGHSNGATTPTRAKEENSGTQAVSPVTLVTNQEVGTQRVVELDPSENQEEKIREEKAAVKAQAAFRGYLARRAFKALKGIIRLQALIRGHLVRRQAVASLHAIHAIVRVQALARGNSVRSTYDGLGTHTKPQFAKGYSDTWKQYASANAFARKLISFDIKVELLHFQYDDQDPNSALSWLSLWTAARPWKPISQPKKTTDAKPVTRKSSYAIETESGKLKRNARKNPVNANTESSQTGAVNLTRSPKKFSAPASEPAQESSPLTELEKVKRSLRKVSSSVQDSSAEIEAERTSISVPRSNNSDLSNGNLIEKSKRHGTGAAIGTLPEIKPHNDYSVPAEMNAKEERERTEIIQNEKRPETEDQIGHLTDAFVSPVEEKPLEEVVTSNEDDSISNENYKTTKRRSSLSTKPEHTENNNILVQNNSPSVPSYMAMTASAKTKLRGQASPRLSDQGSGEKNVSTLRHSLPTSTDNGKLSSHSPRTQRPVHAKGGAKNDKSMRSSREATDKPIVEWRR